MPERTSYAHGTPSWVDLSTPDTAAAKTFYCELFGWDAEDVDAGDSAVYTMFRLNGKAVAGMGEQAAEQRERGIPPFWLSYITVDDIDAVAARVAELGGQVHMEPFDVMDAGRMALIMDPQGATFALWQAGNHIGAEFVNEAGAFSWNELNTTDMEGAKAFYGGLLGWEWDDETMPTGQVYTTWKSGDDMLGGAMTITPQMGDVPPNWMVYFTVADCDATSAKVKDLGGNILVPPMDIPIGRFSVVADPAGAAFTVFQMNPMD